ncbi:MAG: hypothetical protein HY921_03220 [Elusimicrobia bacterium]|nr:hypothetical protein [Elusimicrobiota bacterium]
MYYGADCANKAAKKDSLEREYFKRESASQAPYFTVPEFGPSGAVFKDRSQSVYELQYFVK